ncbi:hypothetical protein FGG08_006994 [Glutinoglossum americanum]|uniref:NB-ARC domain-containing protein n=1 Tax=Glutinoglossum americanum TaxID=1670608 RepID=A0A9P8I0D3_9PEZI|nr:hypothetical protein FGG08_006994 [Glutinoglossum americanum]
MSSNIWKRLLHRKPSKEPETEYGLHILSEPSELGGGVAGEAEAGKVDVDVVAVHGLGGHAINTWTHKDTNKMWLRDFLPATMKGARIMTFGYDAMIHNGKNVLGIMENAENLLCEISHRRQTVEALIMAHQESFYNDILTSTCGVMFMSVPHDGADLALIADRLATIAKVVTRLNTINLGDLRRDTRPLQDISKAFGNLEGFSIRTVVESDETRIPGTRNYVMVVPQTSARLNLGRREVVFSILGSDHHTVCKFRAKEDTQYLKVCNALKTMAEEGLKSSLAPSKHQSEAVGEGPFYEIPLLQVSQYVDRVELLKEIERNFASVSGAESHRRIVVLLGMGGQGKTQLALEHCRVARASEQYQGIFWIDASSPGTARRGFETIAEKVSGPGRVFGNSESKIAFVKDTLGSWGKPWIIVFDNYDNPSEFKNISSYFPQGRSGAILFTSRHSESARLGIVIRVTQMTEEEGTELLLRQSRLERNSDNTIDGRKIVRKLGYLPLAIDQAGAYINARELPLWRFIKHYDERKEVVLKHTPLLWEYRKRLGEDKDEMSLNVFTTWELSFRQVGKNEDERAMICHFLTLSAFFDATKIGENLFRRLASASEPPQWVGLFTSEGVWDGYKYQDILVELRKLSLLQSLDTGTEETRFSLHPLVVEWLKLRADQESRQRYALEAIVVLGDCISAQDQGTIPLQIKLDTLSHVDMCLRNDKEYSQELGGLDPVSLIEPLCVFGSLYKRFCQYQEAKTMYKRTLTVGEELGLMCERALAGCEKALGPDHPLTLGVIHNLGLLYGRQGKLAEAEAMYRRALAGSEKVLGLDHMPTLGAVNSLGILYREQGRLAEAEVMYGRVLAGREKALGPDHPSTLDTVHSLGVLYDSQDRLAEAEAMYGRALTGYEKALGPDHKSTLLTVRGLGLLYERQGKLAEAKAMYQRHPAWAATQTGDTSH